MEDTRLPNWLIAEHFNASYKWESVAATTFPKLLEKLTLHDAYLLAVSNLGNNSLMLVIELDAIWNPGPGYSNSDWPYLLINVVDVLGVFQDFVPDDSLVSTIGNAESQLLTTEQVNNWIAACKQFGLILPDYYSRLTPPQAFHKTEISTVYGGSFTLLHTAAVKLLLYNVDGKPLSTDNLIEA